ncbi:PQQ-dependent sugar dehydrogenase [Candidatus Roizmanbacteria bacterium]|nr:PQQ-dependent sugar dehydrogenase [Candidatus Roizmanbacteria bacterium]
MKRVAVVALIFLMGIISFLLLKEEKRQVLPTTQITKNSPRVEPQSPKAATIAEGLDTPWAIAFLPDKSMLVTERPGRVRFVDKDGKLQRNPVAVLESVEEIGEGGLMGITLHPDFPSNRLIYFYYTYSASGNNTFNRVVRMKYEEGTLKDEEIIIDRIPGNFNHNGGRIKFGPDKLLYITTGDAQNPSQAQDTNSLAGKILRTTDKGEVAPGNLFDSSQGKPFGNLVYSYGHRNPQGIAWTQDKKLWSTEHGPSTLDELNMIESGKNYGWPDIQGNQVRAGMETPMLNSGNATWAPAGADFIGNSLFFGGLRGQTLYEAVINGENISLKEHFVGEFGRIREVITGPDNMLYITTSNKDGRGNPNESDDKVIRINPNLL